MIIGILSVCAIFDIKSLAVPLWSVVVTFLLSVSCLCMGGEATLSGALLSLIPGMMLLLYSLAAKGRTGAGDALIVMAEGPALGLLPTFIALCVAFMLAAAAAVILMLFLKKGRSYRIPFVPFITAGTGVALWLM
ncbi:MAG: prepilin peptidase [Lachnospiraceae bacterium]|nr:prepilin peptidase [Lachnospiraceae bacterium]